MATPELSASLRSLLTIALLFLGLVPVSRAAPLPPASKLGYDIAITRTVSMMREHDGVRQVGLWLRRQPGVRGSRVGRDGTTLSLYFRDGMHTMVLSHTSGTSTRTRRARLTLPINRLFQTGRRALVLEPFRTELDLGTDAGAAESSALRSAGFSVDTYSDAAVTVNVMKTLGSYNVVYDDTHSGVNEYGEGVMATGQVYNANPDLEPYMHEFSVMPVAVAGSPLLFYGVLSHFVQSYIDPFPTGSLVFLNGCDMLRASRVWAAFQQKGVAALVSWDGEVLPSDAVNSAVTFFGAMSSGADVARALAAVRRAGQGLSHVDGQVTAHLDFLGEGRATLSSILSAEQPTPTVTTLPTLTVSPTPVPTTSPPTMAPTATSIPPRNGPLPNPTVEIHRGVGPSPTRVLLIRSVPNALLTLRIRYPNGLLVRATVRTNGSGRASYRYRERPNAVSPASRTVHIVVRVTAHGRVGRVKVQTLAEYLPLNLYLSLRFPRMLWARATHGGLLTVRERRSGHGNYLQRVYVPARRWIVLRLQMPAPRPAWRPGDCVVGDLKRASSSVTSTLCTPSFARGT